MDSLEEKKYDDAFRYSFLLHRDPNDIEKGLDKNWSDIYNQKKENLYCSSCSSSLSIDKAFSMTSNHFFCTVCSMYILEKRGKEILQCPQCTQYIEDPKTDIIFLNHFEN